MINNDHAIGIVTVKSRTITITMYYAGKESSYAGNF